MRRLVGGLLFLAVCGGSVQAEETAIPERNMDEVKSRFNPAFYRCEQWRPYEQLIVLPENEFAQGMAIRAFVTGFMAGAYGRGTFDEADARAKYFAFEKHCKEHPTDGVMDTLVKIVNAQ